MKKRREKRWSLLRAIKRRYTANGGRGPGGGFRACAWVELLAGALQQSHSIRPHIQTGTQLHHAYNTNLQYEEEDEEAQE